MLVQAGQPFRWGFDVLCWEVAFLSPHHNKPPLSLALSLSGGRQTDGRIAHDAHQPPVRIAVVQQDHVLALCRIGLALDGGTEVVQSIDHLKVDILCCPGPSGPAGASGERRGMGRGGRTVSDAGRAGHLVVVEAGVVIARDFRAGQFAIQLVALLGSHLRVLRVGVGGRLFGGGGGSGAALLEGSWVQPAERRGEVLAGCCDGHTTRKSGGRGGARFPVLGGRRGAERGDRKRLTGCCLTVQKGKGSGGEGEEPYRLQQRLAEAL